MAALKLTEGERLNKDVYDQLSRRYEADPQSLTFDEKCCLMLASISWGLTTEKYIKKLTAEVYFGFQRQCDRAKALLDSVENGTYPKQSFMDDFLKIISWRMYEACFVTPGLGNIMSQITDLQNRAMALDDKRPEPPPDPEREKWKNFDWPVDDKTRMKREQRSQFADEERQYMFGRGYQPGPETDRIAEERALFRQCVGTEDFNKRHKDFMLK